MPPRFASWRGRHQVVTNPGLSVHTTDKKATSDQILKAGSIFLDMPNLDMSLPVNSPLEELSSELQRGNPARSMQTGFSWR